MSLGYTKYWQSFIVSSKSLLRALVFIVIQLIIINLLWSIQVDETANFRQLNSEKHPIYYYVLTFKDTEIVLFMSYIG